MTTPTADVIFIKLIALPDASFDLFYWKRILIVSIFIYSWISYRTTSITIRVNKSVNILYRKKSLIKSLKQTNKKASRFIFHSGFISQIFLKRRIRKKKNIHCYN